VALIAAWSQWQPQRAEDARQSALELAGSGRRQAALAQARSAVGRDPLSALALFTLAQVQQVAGEPERARGTLLRAVREQPANPQTWLALGRFDLHSRPFAALHELQATIFLDPEAISPEALARGDREAIAIHNEYIEALRATAVAPVSSARARPGQGARGGRRGPRRRHAR
jgi:tetratricopeptide (TPR) repeat protein